MKFVDIQNMFPKEQWDVGFLTKEQLKICINYPIKWQAQPCGYDLSNNFSYKSPDIENVIVLVRHSIVSLDYSLYDEATEILNQNHIEEFSEWTHIYANFKEAQIVAGLGVRAKNSLIYNYQFGFDSKVCMVGFIGEIAEPPNNKRVNLKYWKKCKGCDDCRIACPAGAIHNEREPYWLDSSECVKFLVYSDHPRMPSVKKFWHKHVHPEKSQEEVNKIARLSIEFCDVDDQSECHDFPWDANGYTADQIGIYKDGKQIPVPHCRECQAQPRCSKWNGVYSYELYEAEIEHI